MNKMDKEFATMIALFMVVSILGTIIMYGGLAAVIFWIAKVMFGV